MSFLDTFPPRRRIPVIHAPNERKVGKTAILCNDMDLRNFTCILLVALISQGQILAQAPAPPKTPAAPPKAPVPAAPKTAAPAAAPAAAKPSVPATAPAAVKTAVKTAPRIASPVDTILRMSKLKLPDSAILSSVRPLLAKTPLSPDDFIKLAEGGVSSSLIEALASGAPAAAAPVSNVVNRVAEAAPAVVVPTISAALAAINTDFSTLSCEVPNAQRKRVVAVDEFDFGTQKTADQAILNTQGAIGTGMTSLAVKRIQEAGKYRVVERKGIKQIIAEQDFGASTRAKQGTTARIGKIQGADAILMGTITTFGRDDKKTTVGAGALAPGVLGAIKFGKKEDKAIVAVSYRLVDAETSEVISTGEARGESIRKSKGLALGGLTGSGGAAGGFDMTSSGFEQTIIGEATIDCMNKLIAILNEQEKKIRLRQVELDTRIADISGKQVFISSGSAESVQKCDKFEVSRIVKEVKDPVTKEILDLQLEKVGELIITDVRDKISIGAFSGTKAPEVGFAVRKILPPAPPEPPPAPAAPAPPPAATAEKKK
jgi:curli biogenesis system outer membrane secretion channel CsgG